METSTIKAKHMKALSKNATFDIPTDKSQYKPLKDKYSKRTNNTDVDKDIAHESLVPSDLIRNKRFLTLKFKSVITYKKLSRKYINK